MFESFSADLYTSNKENKMCLDSPLYLKWVELQVGPVPHLHEKRGVGIGGALLNPTFERWMGGRHRQPYLGHAEWASSCWPKLPIGSAGKKHATPWMSHSVHLAFGSIHFYFSTSKKTKNTETWSTPWILYPDPPDVGAPLCTLYCQMSAVARCLFRENAPLLPRIHQQESPGFTLGLQQNPDPSV